MVSSVRIAHARGSKAKINTRGLVGQPCLTPHGDKISQTLFHSF
jgi:hypothetical protein